MSKQVPKSDGRGIISGAYVNQDHPMDRTQWLEDAFPEWGQLPQQRDRIARCAERRSEPVVVRRAILGAEDRRRRHLLD